MLFHRFYRLHAYVAGWHPISDFDLVAGIADHRRHQVTQVLGGELVNESLKTREVYKGYARGMKETSFAGRLACAIWPQVSFAPITCKLLQDIGGEEDCWGVQPGNE